MVWSFKEISITVRKAFDCFLQRVSLLKNLWLTFTRGSHLCNGRKTLNCYLVIVLSCFVIVCNCKGIAWLHSLIGLPLLVEVGDLSGRELVLANQIFSLIFFPRTIWDFREIAIPKRVLLILQNKIAQFLLSAKVAKRSFICLLQVPAV